MQWFTVSRLSANQEFTGEGYLVCKNVPIARTGVQHYRDVEIPSLDADDSGWISIDREPSEVFSDASIASFTGKPIVDDHPMMPVTVHNHKALSIGAVHNVRRGEGLNHDMLIADLLFNTPEGIARVRSGKRAISVGYDAEYERVGRGQGRQRNIVVNHVALVDEGRCGSRCTIVDGKAIYNPEAAAEASHAGNVSIYNFLKANMLHDMTSDVHAEGCQCDACTPTPTGDAPMTKQRSLRDLLSSVAHGSFFATDKAAVDKIVKDAEEENGNGKHEEPDGDEGEHSGHKGGVHVHIEHKPGETEDSKLSNRVTKLEDSLKSLDAKLTKVLDAMVKVKDEDEEKKDKDDKKSDDAKAKDEDGENEKKDDEDKKTDDDTGSSTPPDPVSQVGEANMQDPPSAEQELMEADPTPAHIVGMGDAAKKAHKAQAIRNLVTDTAARAEVLAPGIKLPTWDAVPDSKTLGTQLCTLRRAALVKAAETDTGKALMGGYAHSVKTMSCDALRIVFRDASERMRALNNQRNQPTPMFGDQAMQLRGYRTKEQEKVASINAANAEYWAKQGVARRA